MDRRHFLLAAAGLALAGCARRFETAFPTRIPTEISRSWTVAAVNVAVPEGLSFSDQNSLAPAADIVWHGDPPGDRRAQVGEILHDAIIDATAELDGPRQVIIQATMTRFHAVTPRAVAIAPAAVHNIGFQIQVFDAEVPRPLSSPTPISASLDALVGPAATVAAIEGQTQKTRIRNHIAATVKAWLSIGPDTQRSFVSLGR